VAWPYMASQCPTCRYFRPFELDARDDAGYQLPGACLHPSIGMELFVSVTRPELLDANCPLRWARPGLDANAPRRREEAR
jgi:hypothetical protein